jgi:hypothetical protein
LHARQNGREVPAWFSIWLHVLLQLTIVEVVMKPFRAILLIACTIEARGQTTASLSGTVVIFRRRLHQYQEFNACGAGDS